MGGGVFPITLSPMRGKKFENISLGAKLFKVTHTQKTHMFSKILFLPIKALRAPPKHFPYIMIWTPHMEIERGFLLLLFTNTLMFGLRHPVVQAHTSLFLGDSVGVCTIYPLQPLNERV